MLDPDEFVEKYADGVAKKTTVRRRMVRPRTVSLYDERHISINELKDHAARLVLLRKAALWL
jgi:hypothetical protein